MKFDLYNSFHSMKQKRWCPGVTATPVDLNQIKSICSDPFIATLCKEYQNGDKEAKMKLPALCFTGRATKGKRIDEQMEPTQFVMIDVDHVENPKEVFNQLYDKKGQLLERENLLFAHITPSGKGLRLIFRAGRAIDNLAEYMLFLDDVFEFHKIGDFDPSVKNFGRISFLVPADYWLYFNEDMWEDRIEFKVNPIKRVGESIVEETKKRKKDEGTPVEEKPKAEEVPLFSDEECPPFSDDEKVKFNEKLYCGFPYKAIVDKYLEVYGTPGEGQRHAYYNDMVKKFRLICDNDKRFLLYILPLFDKPAAYRWSQIVSICRVNTLSRLPKDFYFFLKDNGFYIPNGQRMDSLKDYMLDESEESFERPPYLPPVFRELINTAPKDFILPSINSLLPILGTLTSYLRAIYPYDGREHSTSFFSVIYAPPGTGKGFVERFMDILFDEIKIRDFVQSERENVYLRMISRKSDNEKAPDLPHVSLRIIPAKNSEPEFLQKQRDNQGYHMFTYAAEMDSWAKGVRAAGGNKDDMIRIAWDNGEYGQQFKSANTFKGMVKLYWNVLITGTIAQVDAYFKNVENGLVTRCSFTSIDNQEFAEAPVWKKLSKRSYEVIKNFTKRCDENTYESPCTIMPEDLALVADEDFDKEIDWKFKFKPKQFVDMSWIMPIIDRFHKEQIEKAALDIDRARDVFRRRVGVRGFRLALLCYALWVKPKKKDLEKVCLFVDWWMHQDLECMLKLWGTKYNEQTDVVKKVVQRTVFDSLNDNFTRNDVYAVCLKQGIKTPIRRIIFDWLKLKSIEQLDKNTFRKKH